ncbi:hypothetical protein PYW07_003869 [Mythimna separata]|uniref:Uncharacterized protein n=1 Tax=Mythimna separata TaxID=271217 RepID=A0AAD7YPZ2_MYTSE|nr:hypothetical protein PYW07_003869 [Mythimna separata]
MFGILLENDTNVTNSQSLSGCGAPNKFFFFVEAVGVPTIRNQPGEILKRSGIDLASSTTPMLDLVTSTSAAPYLAVRASDVPDSGASTSAAPDLAASTSFAPGFAANTSTTTSATADLSIHTSKVIKKLKDNCQKQSKKIKRLNEKVRRQTKKIAHFSNIIKDLKERNLLNSESQALLAECAGPQDFLKRQVAKSKGLPLQRLMNMIRIINTC